MKDILTYCMFKNEEDVLERLIRNTNEITKTFVFLDTGSTDNSNQIIEKTCKELNKDFKIIQREFQDFVSTRNYGLDFINENYKNFDYILLMDADELIYPTELNKKLLNELDFHLENSNGKAISMDILEGGQYINHRLRFIPFDNESKKIKFRYDGPGAHEYIQNFFSDQNDYYTLPSTFYILHLHKESKDYKKKYELEYRLLYNYLINNPNNLRCLFYLGNTCFDSQDYNQAYTFYSKYVEISENIGYENVYLDELYEVFLRLGFIFKTKSDFKSAISIYKKGIANMPYRKECYYFLCKLYYELNLVEKFDQIVTYMNKILLYSNLNKEEKFINSSLWFDSNLIENTIYHWYFKFLLEDCKNKHTNLTLDNKLTNIKLVFYYYFTNRELSNYNIKSEEAIFLENNNKWFYSFYSNYSNFRNENSKNIVFYLGDMHPFNLDLKLNETLESLDDMVLGGTEKSYIELAKLMAKKHNVYFLVNQLDKDYIQNDSNIIFMKKEFFEIFLNYFINIDTLIFSRSTEEPFKYVKKDQNPNMKKILWIHDILIGDVNYDNVDEIVVGTYFHKKYLYLNNIIKSNKKINVIPLGISDISLFDYFNKKKIGYENQIKIIYHIHPERGLLSLLNLFPILKEKLKNELNIELFLDLYIDDKNDIGKTEYIEKLDKELFDDPNINIFPCLKHSELIKKLNKYDLFFYIHDLNWRYNNNLTFLETFCLSIVEAQLANLVVFGSEIGALENNLIDSPFVTKLNLLDGQNLKNISEIVVEKIKKLNDPSFSYGDEMIKYNKSVNSKFKNWKTIYKKYWKELI